MKRRIPAFLLAIVMLITLLCGCSNQTTDGFYALCDEIWNQKDVQFSLTLPYHGAELTAQGILSRTNQAADIKMSLAGTQGADGELTEVVISGRQIWINVAQLSERTLAFSLPEMRRMDIQELAQDQQSDWVNYKWEGDLWDGIPEWEALLSQLWQDLRSDLNGHIQAGEQGYTLSLKGNSLNKATQHVTSGLQEQYDTYRNAFVKIIDDENGIVTGSQLDPGLFFDDYWYQIVEPEQEGEDPLDSLTLSIERTENEYTVLLSADDNALAALQMIPIAPASVEPPEEYMDFRSYYDNLFYLISFSKTYIGDALEGRIPEESSIQEEPEEPFVDPLVTEPVADYADLAAVELMAPGESIQKVPILTGYDSCEAGDVSEQGILADGFSIGNSRWTQQVSVVPASGTLSDAVSETLERYYEAYINVTGCLLVQDLSDIVRSQDGETVIQGFSYRENDYAKTEARLIVVSTVPDGSDYVMMELYLNLSELTQTEKDMVLHWIEYLGLETPILLEP